MLFHFQGRCIAPQNGFGERRRAYGAQIILGIDPQPFRAGLTFGGAALRA
jgi:hypothetical protein